MPCFVILQYEFPKFVLAKEGMSFEKLRFDDEKIYKTDFRFEDWMEGFSTHPNQRETVFRYEFCKKHGIDRFAWGCNSLDLYNVLKGRRLHEHKHQSLDNQLRRDFPHYECLDHSLRYKNSVTGETWVMSLVYLDTREKIRESCDKWGFDVEFYSWNGVDYHWMYVVYKNKEE